MKVRLSWRFWSNVVCCLLSMGLFILTGSIFSFTVSVICCFMSIMMWKLEHYVFDFEQSNLNKSFKRQIEMNKEKEKDKDNDF